jgi:hypothetical protein
VSRPATPPKEGNLKPIIYLIVIVVMPVEIVEKGFYRVINKFSTQKTNKSAAHGKLLKLKHR